jgi:hypothetical protein
MRSRVTGREQLSRRLPRRCPAAFPTQVQLVIATVKGKYEEAYARLREGLVAAGVPDEAIITVYGNEAVASVETKTVRLRHNLYEYNAFVGTHVWCQQHPAVAARTRAFLLLHDTCDVGGAFVPKLRRMLSAFLASNTDVWWASRGGLCNICLFSRVAAQAFFRRFQHRLSIDKMHAIDMEHKATNSDSVKSFKELRQQFDGGPATHTGVAVMYSNGQPRQKLHFSSLDVTKYYVFVQRDGPQHPNEP